MTINNSKKDEYYTQLNNKRVPFAACGRTATVNSHRNSKVPQIQWPSGIQPEDHVYDLIHSDIGYGYAKSVDSSVLKNKSSLARYGWMLAWAFNYLAGQEICRWEWRSSIEELVYQLVQGKCPMVHGKFPCKRRSGETTEIGHYQSLVGVVSEQPNLNRVSNAMQIDIPMIREFIIDDPYGNPNTQYETRRGNDVHVSYDFFIEHISNQESQVKWGLVWT